MGRAHRSLILLAVASALASACGEDRTGAPVAADGGMVAPDAGEDAHAPVLDGLGAAWLEVGIGEETFAPLPADGVVELLLGPQALWMSFFALRGAGFDPAGPTVEIRAEMGVEPVAILRQRKDFALGDGVLAAAGFALVYDPDVQPYTMEGRDVALEVVVVDGAGRTAATNAMVRPRMAE
ncbi:MAG: hypothetical protein AABZ30_05700 [Myxococcota bacterium]